MSVSRSRYEVLRARLDAFTRALDKAKRGDARAIHRARVASRRLRELVPVLQLNADVSRRLLRSLREVTRELGTLREADVVLALIEGLQAEPGKSGNGGLSLVLDEVRTRRQDVQSRILKKAFGKRLTRVAKRLDKAAVGLEAHESRLTRRWIWAIDARVAHRAGALRGTIDEAGALYLPERLHEVRKAMKKLRYALELQHDVTPRYSRSELNRLRRGQELLGTLHDRQMVIDRIRTTQASAQGVGERHRRRELDAILVSLEDDCRRIHGRYLRGRRELLNLCGSLTSHTGSLHASTRRGLRSARS